MRIRAFAAPDRAAVVDLWQRCELVRPWNNPDLDIDRKLTRDPDHFLVADDDGTVVGTVMLGYDGHRGWLYYLGVEPSQRGSGVGRRLVEEAEARLLALGCPKVNLQIRTDNVDAVDFYRALGYSVDAVLGMGRRLIPDD